MNTGTQSLGTGRGYLIDYIERQRLNCFYVIDLKTTKRRSQLPGFELNSNAHTNT